MQPLVPLVFHNLPSLYPPSFIYIVRTSSSQCACVTCARLGKKRESVVPANLCIVVGCATKRARGYRDRRGQLDIVCGTGLYRLGGTFLGLNQVRRVAGESDEDREGQLQALRTKKVE